MRSTCCPVPSLPTNISGCLECSFCGFHLPTPPPVLCSSQRDILGWGGGWFRGVGGVSSFLCVYVIYLTILPPQMAFSRSSYLYGTSNKDPRLRLGLATLGLSLLTAGPWQQLPPAPIAALGGGPSSPRCGSWWRRHLGWGCCQAQAGEGGAAGGESC